MLGTYTYSLKTNILLYKLLNYALQISEGAHCSVLEIFGFEFGVSAARRVDQYLWLELTDSQFFSISYITTN